MRRYLTWLYLGLGALVLQAAFPLIAQVPRLGNGFALGPAGSITSDAGEVIFGRSSIKGAYFGTGSTTNLLQTDSSIIKFLPGQSYRIECRYRIVTAPSGEFQLNLYSHTGGPAGFARLSGVPGDTGIASITSPALGPYSDYSAIWTIVGTGAIVIDEIRITDAATGQVIAAEDAEGPSVKPGLLAFQLANAKSFYLGPTPQWYIIRSGTVRDLDGDAYSEIILTVTTYPDQLPQLPIILSAKSGIVPKTNEFFPDGAPKLRHSPITKFADINGDGQEDILFANSLDIPPWTGSGIGVGIGLNLGGGKYKDVSSLVPADLQIVSSYSVAAGDPNNDGRVEIIVPDGGRGQDTALLRWNGTGFDVQRNWIDPALWTGPTFLRDQSWLGVYDLDNDGNQDLLVAGNWTRPNLRLVFGGAGGFTTSSLLTLPDGPFGHTSYESTLDPTIPWTQGADTGPVVVADFDNDGRLDIFALEEQFLHYQVGVITDTKIPAYANILANGGGFYADMVFQVFMNKGSRQFVENTSASSAQHLGWRIYEALIPIDMNNDGFVDIVAVYSTKPYGALSVEAWGTTFFLNDGTGTLQVIDGSELLPTFSAPLAGSGQKELGGFLPTLINAKATEGLVVESVNNLATLTGTPGGLLNVTKVTSNKSLGTGPGFVNSATLGVPGFNEFYYLRTHSDAAAAVEGGQYANGLAHYLAVGKGLGYDAFAPNATIVGSDQFDTLTLNGRRAEFAITTINGGIVLTDMRGHYGTLKLQGVERVQFSDAAVDLFGSAYSRDYVQKAYVAYYGRPADPAGQTYWALRMDAEGRSLNAIIGAFGNSDEFNRRYGGLSYAALVTKIYQQALNRDPDPAGLAYYVGELQAGRRTLQTITLDVLNGATTAPDSTVVANKLGVAAYYTVKVAAGCSYGTEQDGVNALAGVTATPSTATAAKVAIDSRCGP